MDSSSDDDDVFNFKKRAAAVAQAHRVSRLNDNDDDDDSDSDDSDASHGIHQKSKKSKFWDENDDDCDCDENQIDEGSKNKEDIVVVLNSDDDSDLDDCKMTASNIAQSDTVQIKIAIDDLVADKETHNALLKAREARMALLKTTGDINVDVSDDENLMEDMKVASDQYQNVYKPYDDADVKPQGPSISLKLRTTITRGSVTSQGSIDNFTMYAGEKFASLLEKYRSKYKLLPSDVVKMSFDGQVLNLHSKPDDLDMDDDDLLDVSLIHISELKGSNYPVKTLSSKVESDAVTIVTRIKGGDSRITHKYVLKRDDPFRKLINAYRKEHGYSSVKPVSLEYSGKTIDPDSTPEKLKMKGETLIEVIDVEEKLKQLERSGKLLENTPDDHHSSKISLKLRITNKGESNMTEQLYELGLHDSFRILVNQFCEKNKCTEKECKFRFDGANLSLNASPDDEGLEGGEIIEVSVERIEKSKATQPKKSSDKTINAAGGVIAVNTTRKNGGRTRKFVLNSNDNVGKLTTAYIKAYQSKGCLSVRFYHNGSSLNENNSFFTQGVKDLDTLIAIENGNSLQSA